MGDSARSPPPKSSGRSATPSTITPIVSNRARRYVWIADTNGRRSASAFIVAPTAENYIDSCAFGSTLEIRGDNDAFRHIAGQWVYPRIKSTDTIKRNGFKGYCHAMHPVTLFQQLLTNPQAETLMKSGDIEMLRYLCQHPQEVDKYWNSIKVAKRAGYTFNALSM